VVGGFKEVAEPRFFVTDHRSPQQIEPLIEDLCRSTPS
jgi:hypothetical protein